MIVNSYNFSDTLISFANATASGTAGSGAERCINSELTTKLRVG